MQLNNRGGSMGIPEELIKAQEKQKLKNAAKDKVVKEVDPFEDDEETTAKDSTQNDTPTQEKDGYEKVGAEDILERLGIEFTEEDMQAMIYKGCVEKDIVVIKGHLVAKMRTLTEEEYRTVDSLLTEEAKEKNMSVNGYNARKSVLILCFGVTHLAGKEISKKKPATEDGQVDLEALALQRAQVFAKMGGAVVDKLIETHGALSVAVNMVVRDPESLLKNS